MNRELTVKIGNRLRNLRHEQGLSLNELSLKMGSQLSKSRISNYEQGIRRPGIEPIRLLAEALNSTPAHLMFLDEMDPFTEDEHALIGHYRNADPRGQEEILRVAGLEVGAAAPAHEPAMTKRIKKSVAYREAA